ncbi:MAG: TniQ family protein, partial [Nostoc sp.]
MKPRPIRLCGACYQESPCHRVEWQFKDVMVCDRHQLRLLTKCTNCETPFPIPADWVQGECPHCFLPFATMAKRQKRC